MKKPTIGIVGKGFVGSAVAYGFREVDVVSVDVKDGTTVSDLAGKGVDYVFVAVPTPRSPDWSVDTAIIDSVIDEIHGDTELRELPVVIKSTVTPDVLRRYADKLPKLAFNPEFLTERNHLHDFVHPPFQVVGSDSQDLAYDVLRLYRRWSSVAPCAEFATSLEEASFVKYAINSWLAAKVVFFNQLRDVMTEKQYSTVEHVLSHEHRIGPTHMRVPGPDGRRGVGGKCFSKDPHALVAYGRTLGKSLSVLEEAMVFNEDEYGRGAE